MDQQSMQIRKKREYIRVAAKTKERLFHLVFLKGKRIKEASNILNIKYATAKTIIYFYKQENLKNRILPKEGSKRCEFAIRTECSAIEVVVKIGGQLITNQ